MLKPFDLSYVNVNMLIYIGLIPLVWAFILDIKLRTKGFLRLGYFLILIVSHQLNNVPLITYFKSLCSFVKYMQGIHHCTYAESCVIWCMLVPLLITIILVALPRRAKKLNAVAAT
jgi:hypothetical protein